MQGWKRWAGVGIALGVIIALSPLLTSGLKDPLTGLSRGALQDSTESLGPDLRGLNLLRYKYHPRRVTTPLRHGRTAELTLDPELQRSAVSVMKRYGLPEAGAVLMDVRTGEVLVYANHVQDGLPFDINARSDAPAASLFKLITAAALLENPAITSQTEQCYRGGKSKIVEKELQDNPDRDRWCASLAIAMGRSINVVFARMARKNLTPEALTRTAGAFGFGAPTPFDILTDAPSIDLPTDPLGFARAAAGFWHTTLSPLAATSISQTVASGGLTIRPRIVRRILDEAENNVVWQAPKGPVVLRRAMAENAARQLTLMMMQTVASGSAFKTFHDRKGTPFLPHIKVAGKTGTLTRRSQNRHYTWFTGFAPADAPRVAVAALVVNTPTWKIKGPLLAREVLRAYFAKNDFKGVSRP